MPAFWPALTAKTGCGSGARVLIRDLRQTRGGHAPNAGYPPILRVFVENDASRGLMRSAGFREVGIYERHARLAGRWRDVVIVEKSLAEP